MVLKPLQSTFFFFNDTATTEIYTLSLHDALPISSIFPAPSSCATGCTRFPRSATRNFKPARPFRSEEHTSELQSLRHLVCRLLLEKKKTNYNRDYYYIISALVVVVYVMAIALLSQ